MNALQRPLALLLLSVLLLVASGALIFAHVSAVDDMRDIGFAAALSAAAQEKRIAVLRQQVDITELNALTRSASSDELWRLYVLPAQDDATRLLAILDTLFLSLRARGLLTEVSPIEIGMPETEDLLTRLPVRLSVSLTPEGLQEFLYFVDATGILSVGDVLTDSDRLMLLSLLEEENPATATALESFLSTDIVRFASREKQSTDELMSVIASDEIAAAVQDMLRHSRLQEVATFFRGSLGIEYVGRQLWPFRFLRVSRIHADFLSPSSVRIAVTLSAYGRRQPSP